MGLRVGSRVVLQLVTRFRTGVSWALSEKLLTRKKTRGSIFGEIFLFLDKNIVNKLIDLLKAAIHHCFVSETRNVFEHFSGGR